MVNKITAQDYLSLGGEAKFVDLHINDAGEDIKLTSWEANTAAKVSKVLLADAHTDDQVNGTNSWTGGEHVLFTNTPDADTVRKMAQHNLATGTTSFLPTIISSEFSRFVAAMEAVKSIPSNERQVLGIGGVHLEGRWIDRAGIHNKAHMDNMKAEECTTLCRYGREGILKVVTVSPRMVTPGQIKSLVAAGIIVSIGHTNASAAEVAVSMRAGAKHITHLGNVMSPDGVLRVRRKEDDPVEMDGLLNYGLRATGERQDEPRALSSIIMDGIHVEEPMLRLMYSTHGAYSPNLDDVRCSLTTDAATLPSKQGFEFPFGPGGAIINYDADTNKCSDAKGTLGGAATTQELGVEKMLSLGVPLKNALFIASRSYGVFPERKNLDDKALYDSTTGKMIGYIRNGVLTLLAGQKLDSYAA